MKMTYADICIERAEKTSPGPWHEVDGERILVSLEQLPDLAFGLLAEIYDPAMPEDYQRKTEKTVANALFISRARQDVPELARRLKRACARLRDVCAEINSPLLLDIIDELERIPEEK